MDSAVHSCATSEWYSPPEIVEPYRALVGEIDLDPASCEAANARTVVARSYYSLATPGGGLAQRWEGRVWCNPPSPPRAWWERAVAAIVDREAESILFVAYSLEALQQSQGWGGVPMTAFSVCIPRRRIRYLTTVAERRAQLAARAARSSAQLQAGGRGWWQSGVRASDRLATAPLDDLVPGDAPTHGSALVGMGVDHEAFAAAYAGVGEVLRGSGRRR